MKTKEEYQAEMEEQISKLHTKIDELKVQASLAKADAKDKYHEQIEVLNDKYAVAREKLQELKASSGNAWQDIRAGLESAWDELQTSFKRASTHFK
ncbi:hypothetical protein I8748_26565 [Nostoc sp. CENA67]|uniref:Coiled coil domain-containing protein n=1 Tax=Amazonocrinis nigriterrae CENA67 TaxID=2794033 RepID=A0A8J7I022_9NOST|nr:hypothetical protein [Amazonocrinis nigriterrae]MBH8565694.1 hypothetical protein [Amazonocrinis nigriterrae CENA67]